MLDELSSSEDEHWEVERMQKEKNEKLGELSDEEFSIDEGTVEELSVEVSDDEELGNKLFGKKI